MTGTKSGLERLISRSNPGPVPSESPLLQRGELEPWMVGELRDAERNIRHWRLEVERRLAGGSCKRCASCGEAMPGRAARLYCSHRCRQAAYRARTAPPRT